VGLIGIFCSAQIYKVPARPAWNSWTTAAEFLLTALVLSTHPIIAPAAALAQAALQVAKFYTMQRSEEFELRQSARLLGQDFRLLLVLRVAALLVSATLPGFSGFALALAAEFCGRYLFFVTVVPRNMAATFFGTAKEAA
jgi:formate dehydrogenase iron-sulfur subunit